MVLNNQKILVICNVGISSSLMAKVVMEQVFDDANVQAEIAISSFDKCRAIVHNYDFIVCQAYFAHQLQDEAGLNIVTLDNLTDEAEIKIKVLPLLMDSKSP